MTRDAQDARDARDAPVLATVTSPSSLTRANLMMPPAAYAQNSLHKILCIVILAP